jgi:hypothetical protein
MNSLPVELVNVFTISFETLNLFSFILGAMWGLSTSCYNRFRHWWVIVGYFVTVAIFFALKAGVIR